jgi:hypothetical protein
MEPAAPGCLQSFLEAVGSSSSGCDEGKECGRASFPVQFHLGAKRVLGAIVQHVKVVINIRDCDTFASLEAINFEYFEAWNVTESGVPKPFSELSESRTRFNDLFQICGMPHSCGSATITARIAYAEKYVIRSCDGGIEQPNADCWNLYQFPYGVKPRDFCDPRLKNRKVPFAGILFRKEIAGGSPAAAPPNSPPSFWNAAVEANANTKLHSMEWDWNCCDCNSPCPFQDKCVVIPTK